MQGPYPGALRMRVIDFVEAGGSRREAAEQFDVSVSSAIRWLQHFRNDGRSEPAPSGGSVSPLEKHAQGIFTLIAEQPDLTLDEMVRVLRKRRIPVPTGNPKRLTSSRESVDSQPDGRGLRVHLVRHSRAIPVAGGVASRNPRSSSPAQYSAP
jgi:transposase-like protein